MKFDKFEKYDAIILFMLAGAGTYLLLTLLIAFLTKTAVG